MKYQIGRIKLFMSSIRCPEIDWFVISVLITLIEVFLGPPFIWNMGTTIRV